jgi:hypothetical protein
MTEDFIQSSSGNDSNNTSTDNEINTSPATNPEAVLEEAVDNDPHVVELTKRLIDYRAGKSIEDEMDLVKQIREAREQVYARLRPEETESKIKFEQARQERVKDLIAKLPENADEKTKLQILGMEKYGEKLLPKELLSVDTRQKLVAYLHSILAFNAGFTESEQQKTDVPAMMALDKNRSNYHKAVAESLSNDLMSTFSTDECREIIEQFVDYKINFARGSRQEFSNDAMAKVIKSIMEQYGVDLNEAA